MNKKLLIISTIIILIASSFSLQTQAETEPGEIYNGEITVEYRNVTVYAPAVASTEEGYVGVISTITVTIQNQGSGRVFVDTLPLTQIDMQGSARLAVKVASALVKRDNIGADEYDFFFVVRTDAPIIGGPSAGAIMTVATIALLENWTLDENTIMTGMINPDGSIGPIGGIPQKIDAANSVGAKRFLIPKGQGTYTEMSTTTETVGGWTRTVTKPVTKYVAEYAMENYGIEVIEVEDINEAINNFTGYVFPVVKSDENISTIDYEDSMKPLASTLLDEADSIYKNASNLFDNSSIPSYYFADYESQIRNILKDAEDRFTESQQWYNKGLYYTSTTKSFQSLIDSRFVYYACEYFNKDTQDLRETYLEELMENVTEFYEEKSEIARNAEINGMISLQCVGAAQKRVTEAESNLEDARENYDQDDYWSDLNVIYKLAFAMERSKSVGWWINISSHFNETGEITASEIENLALEYIEDAQQSITYSTVILQEVGSSSVYISSANELLQSARDDVEKDYPASALFEALEALVKANLAIENIDDDAEGKIERSKENAESSISESRDLGIEPVLSVSYYELGQSYENESSYDNALIYYKFSDIIAGALSFSSFSKSSAQSRYTGLPESETPIWRQFFSNIENLWIFTILIFMMGLGGGLIIAGFVRRETSKNKKEKWVPRNIDDYTRKQKNQYFPNDHTPRSIQDYYKKQK